MRGRVGPGRTGGLRGRAAFAVGLAVLAGILPMVPALAAVTMQAATARVEITPSALGFATYFRAGYAGLQPVTQASAPLYATGLLVVDSAGRRSVVVSAIPGRSRPVRRPAAGRAR